MRTIKTINEPFVNANMAILAATSVQIYFALSGYLVSTYISLEVNTIEVSVHRKKDEELQLPSGYLVTSREESEHRSSTDGSWVCVTIFHFGYTN